MLLTTRRHRTARDAAIGAALTLRAPALALLAGRALDDAGRAALGVSAVAWHIFLTSECCAAPLARALRLAGVWGTLAPDVRAAVAAAESREMQRVLMARAQLAELDALAAALDVMPIVLKGGATIADGTLVDLGDVDLLVTRDVADLLVTALKASGHTCSGTTVRTLVREGALPVEVHTAVRYGRVPVTVSGGGGDTPPVVPLAGCRALRRLVGAPALVLLLRHSVSHHPFRRGHLRDLVVIAEALGRCTSDEIDAAARTCAAEPNGPALVEMLALAQAVRTGARVQDTGAVRRAAAKKYLVAFAARRRGTRRWPALVAIALDGVATRQAPLWAGLLSGLGGLDPDSPWACGRLGQRAPRAMAALVAPARVACRAFIFLGMTAAALRTRFWVARLLA